MTPAIPLPVSLIKWGRIRTGAELLSNSLRDNARYQSVHACNEAAGRLPFIRVKFAYRKCWIYILGRTYDVDKIRSNKLQMAMIFEASLS